MALCFTWLREGVVLGRWAGRGSAFLVSSDPLRCERYPDVAPVSRMPPRDNMALFPYRDIDSKTRSSFAAPSLLPRTTSCRPACPTRKVRVLPEDVQLVPLALLTGGDLQGLQPAGRARRFAIGRVWNVRPSRRRRGVVG